MTGAVIGFLTPWIVFLYSYITCTRYCGDYIAVAQRFPKGSQVGYYTIILLSPTGRNSESGDDLIEDQRHVVFLGDLSYLFEIALLR